MTLSLAHLAATRAACDALNDLGIALTADDVTSIRNSLLSPIRAAMIRDEYHSHPPKRGEAEAWQMERAEKYAVSLETIRSILLYRR
jgi:hypothetical protein